MPAHALWAPSLRTCWDVITILTRYDNTIWWDMITILRSWCRNTSYCQGCSENYSNPASGWVMTMLMDDWIRWDKTWTDRDTETKTHATWEQTEQRNELNWIDWAWEHDELQSAFNSPTFSPSILRNHRMAQLRSNRRGIIRWLNSARVTMLNQISSRVLLMLPFLSAWTPPSTLSLVLHRVKPLTTSKCHANSSFQPKLFLISIVTDLCHLH